MTDMPEPEQPEVDLFSVGGDWILVADLPDSYPIPAGTSEVELWY